eukprot:g36210.t1
MGTPRCFWVVDKGEEMDGVQQQFVQDLSFYIFKRHEIKILETAQDVGHRLPRANVKFCLSRGVRRRDSTAHLIILQLVHTVGSEHCSFQALND